MNVIQFYVDRKKELQERWHSAQSEVCRLEEWMDENDKVLEMLREDQKRMSKKGPYAEYKSAPAAIRAYLSQNAPSQTDTIVEQLLQGGFPTSSANFKQVVRVALARMKKNGEADATRSGGWYLISAAEQEKAVGSDSNAAESVGTASRTEATA